MALKLGMWVNYHKEFLTITFTTIRSSGIPRSHDKQLGKMMNYLEVFLHEKSLGSLVAWSCEIT